MNICEAIKHAREVAESRTDLCEECRNEHLQLANWLTELQEVKAKIEQGTLIELHCKIGDIVYETEGVRIYEHKIDRIIYVDKMLIYDTNEIMFDERAIGVSIFLTREEAEKRLLELQGETKL